MTEEEPSTEPKLSSWQRRLQTFYNPTHGLDQAEIVLLAAFQGAEEPTTFQEAWWHPDPETREK